MYGRNHTNETKRKISEANKGKLKGTKNPTYGTTRPKHVREALSKYRIGSIWMYNDALQKTKQVKSEQVIAYQIDGWVRGRKSYKAGGEGA